MENLRKNGYLQDNFIIIESQICGISITVSKRETAKDKIFIENLGYSYLNNFNQALSAYIKISCLLGEVKPYKSNELANIEKFFKSVDSEILITDYTYLMITKLKSSIDLLSCLVDYLIKQKRFEFIESKLTDINKLKHKNSKFANTINEFADNPAVYEIINIRNCIIHRGFLIASTIYEHNKIELVQKIEHGIDKTKQQHINIFSLMNTYLPALKKFEFEISKHFTSTINSIPLLTGKFNDYVVEYKQNI